MTDSLVVLATLDLACGFFLLWLLLVCLQQVLFDPPSSCRRCRVFENVVVHLSFTNHHNSHLILALETRTYFTATSPLVSMFVTVSETKIFAIFL
jgi:hypothetical protein